MKFLFSKKGKSKKSSNSDEYFDFQALAQPEADDQEKKVTVNKEDDWLDEEYYDEGQLAVDVFQTQNEIVIKSTIAGVRPEDIDISINNDMVTIRGKREIDETISQEDYFYQECYWGGFSRSIILPVEIRPDKVQATLKNGVLTIVLPKSDKTKTVSVKVHAKDEEE